MHRFRRRLQAPLVLLLLLPWARPLAAQGAPDPDEALRNALRGLDGTSQEGLEAARRRWPEQEREIRQHIPKQDEAVSAGGPTLDDRIAHYEARAEINGTAVNHYLAGRILVLSGRLDQARAHFERCVAVDKHCYCGHHGLGTYFAMRQMPEPAAKHYRRALALRPDFVKAKRGLAMCQMSMGRYDEAEVLFQQILQAEGEDTETRLAFARMLMGASRYTDAIEQLQEIKRRDPDNHEHDAMLALCYSRSEQMDAAVELYGQVLERDPDNWRAALELGRIHYRRGHNHEAAGAFDRALAAMPVQTRVDREELEELVESLRSRPAVSEPPPGKSPDEWINILLNGVEAERRRKAVRVIANTRYRHAEFDRAMLQALRDEDPEIRTIALKTVARWWEEAGALEGDERFVKILGLLLRDRHRLVRGMAADVLGRTDHPRAVPPLVAHIQHEQDPYTFRQMHRALNELTFAYIEVDFEGAMDAEAMDRLSKAWKSWYDEHIFRYRKYEEDR